MRSGRASSNMYWAGLVKKRLEVDPDIAKEGGWEKGEW